MSKSVTPKYRRKKSAGHAYAVVTIAGVTHYLGKHGTAASKREYERIVGEWLAAGRPAHPQASPDKITVTEVFAAYWRFAKGYYVKNGRPTETLGNIRRALKMVRQVYGLTNAAEFGPLSLKAIQKKMIEDGLARRTINYSVEAIRRAFKWAVSEELIPPTVHQGLQAVSGLRKGRTKARETAPVLPIDDDTVEKTLPHLPAVVGDMVRLQRLTGGRPQDVCNLRPCDIDTTGEVWLYRPERHKTEHHGRERVICIGPKTKDILRPYLLRADDAHCFSPTDSERNRRREAHEARKTPLSCGNKPGTNKKRKPKRSAGDGYSTDSYRRAIHRGCVKAGVEKWAPNRLRHTAATEIRRRYGIEGAQVVLGHAAADVTQVYAERDLAKAAAIMQEVG